jgi:preprotein translocase subunit YajC
MNTFVDAVMLVLFVLFMVFIISGYHKNKSAQRDKYENNEDSLK